MSNANSLNFNFAVGILSGIAISASVQYVVSVALGAKYGSTVGSRSLSVVSGGAGTNKSVEETFAKLSKEFTVPASKLQEMVRHFISEVKKSLVTDGQSSLLMIPTHVVSRPTGKELGSYLALDMGGTNFRVCEVTLEGRGRVRMRQKKYTISDSLKNGPGNELFDFFADAVVKFLQEADADISHHRKLGFTFSFAVDQTSINRGTLMLWTKGFTCPGVIGNDVVQLLQEAFTRKASLGNLNITVSALVNDTAGTLAAHAYTDPQTLIGVILGTGTNAAYVENVHNVKKYKGPISETSKEMIMNTEWGGYDEESVLPFTKYDVMVDRQSANPNSQRLEKMISGMYLGEVTRLVIMELISTGELFSGRSSAQIQKQYSFETAFMSRIERDHTLELSDTKAVIEDLLGVKPTTLDDRRIVKRICELIGTRSARLSAALIAGLVTKINKLDGCTVAIDGSLFEHYPHYANRMRDTLRELLGLTAENIILDQARDGSGQGAALIAALHG
ncbi:hexokinase-domain-containing protein [Polychytrium aggregatum]|uniref:hexokinase-domain-containing protein n=1 Tax=Polychytrium aggregatum TaxID=110093 RepID=UPI0022FF22D2|nr:hexokinase-domain-containing protein [Polychytrium aggregatum]KAI9204576.1 hexokinase-domain-containing protein [Polychytrium aggregatum]